MRLAVLNLFNGNVDILDLSEEATEKFNASFDSELFFFFLGYEYDCIDFMDVKGIVQEHKVVLDEKGNPCVND